MIKEENVLSVLMYLFKNHMQNNAQVDTGVDDKLLEELEDAGFGRPVIIDAFDWLADLDKETDSRPATPHPKSFRPFSAFERERIDLECRGFILLLEQQGILTPVVKEIVIAQVIKLGSDLVDINIVKWVTLMVLFNEEDQEEALTTMEMLVLDNTIGGMQ